MGHNNEPDSPPSASDKAISDALAYLSDLPVQTDSPEPIVDSNEDALGDAAIDAEISYPQESGFQDALAYLGLSDNSKDSPNGELARRVSTKDAPDPPKDDSDSEYQPTLTQLLAGYINRGVAIGDLYEELLDGGAVYEFVSSRVTDPSYVRNIMNKPAAVQRFDTLLLALGSLEMISTFNMTLQKITDEASPQVNSQSSELSRGWMRTGRCNDQPPSLFFPSDGVGVEVAKKICADCPAKDPCLEYALMNRIDHGIWGGTSERQRRRILKSRRQGTL